ncbi:MAG: 30S ribosomal protein S9 [Candidatus Omnitrophica bacterium]|nr:MAG: 30S ribosomal protein S9 [Candidatus Hinthialibacteria bacterium OLB16]MBE7488883.1 30S ribosomal protein S9 [bacterium]MCC6734443.1 30S ribosomal protein S9 [Candidatus Omnitrophota bacterium]MCE7907493.1 30S ribosomal protein S9 [Candidatus Omnitrophica bacterium COP1]MBV6482450.1 30S ribosomal protein S9 [bacterium]
MPVGEYNYGTGRRKTATARVFIKPGSGKIVVNGLDADQYFGRSVLSMIIRQPFDITDTNGKYDVMATIQGGGKSGQAGALRHGVSRALCDLSINNRAALKAAGLLTRDPRMVERKKYGQRGARARFQFSKR